MGWCIATHIFDALCGAGLESRWVAAELLMDVVAAVIRVSYDSERQECVDMFFSRW